LNEDALREGEQKFRGVIEQSLDGIVIADEQGNIIEWNQAQETITGYGKDAFLGKSLWDMQFSLALPEFQTQVIYERSRDVVLEILRTRSSEKFGRVNEYKVRRPDGEIRAIETVIYPIDAGEKFWVGSVTRDITEQKRAEEALRSRDRYLTLMNMTASDILDPRKASDRYYYLINHLANLFVADYACLVQWDSIKKRAVLAASTLPQNQPAPELVFEPGQTVITETVLQTRSPLVIEDIPNSEYAQNACLSNQPLVSAQSALAIPLIAGDTQIGALIFTYNDPKHFSSDEIVRARQVSNQVALILWTIEKEADAQKRLKETNALARIGQALSETQSSDLTNVFQLIADSARELIAGAEQAVIHSIGKNQEDLIPQAVAGFDQPRKSEHILKVDQSISGYTLATGESIIVSDAETDERFPTRRKQLAFRSLMVAPIQSRQQKLGTISVQSKKVNAFTEGDSRMLEALGTQAAIAIENTHLLETIRQSLRETNALYHVTRQLVSSLDAEKIMEDVVELLHEKFGYYHVQIYVKDKSSGDFVMRAGSGEIGKKLKRQGYRLRAGEGIVGYTAETGKPFFTNNVDEVISFVRPPFLSNSSSELAVPIKVDSQFLGLLDVHQIPPAQLDDKDMQLVSAVADQLAVALQKANLYTDLHTSLKQEQEMRSKLVQSEKLNVAGRLLASVSHELNNPIQAIQNALFLLKDEKGLSDQGRQDLEIVLSETERMASLLERLRSTYRPVNTEDFKPIQINEVIEDVYALVATHLRQSQISFEFHTDPGLPAIPGLPSQLRQVFLNLFINAVDAMPGGGHLTVTTQLQPDNHEILITVADTGQGIEKEILPTVFEAFVTSKQGGTGLGLTISQEIITEHGGRMQAENQPKQGALVSVWLPSQERGQR
jgi:PAS domain S-box-containing protein